MVAACSMLSVEPGDNFSGVYIAYAAQSTMSLCGRVFCQWRSDLSQFYNWGTIIRYYFGEVLVDGCEFTSARICESFDETVDVSEACFHAGSHLSKSFIDAGEAFLVSLFHSIEAVTKIDFCHMQGV